MRLLVPGHLGYWKFGEIILNLISGLWNLNCSKSERRAQAMVGGDNAARSVAVGMVLGA